MSELEDLTIDLSDSKKLEEYKSYYDKSNDTLLFERILATQIEESGSEVEGSGKLRSWGPNEESSFYVNVYFDSSYHAFRQRTYGGWHEIMKDAIETLVMKPLLNDQTRLINVNRTVTSLVRFDEDEFDWRIVDWFTRVTKSEKEAFKEISSFPVKGNLLCDLIVWENKHGEQVNEDTR
jgi:hypothetical protein